MNVEEGLRVGDVRGLVARRWPYAAILATGIFLVSVVVAAVLPNQYETYATILVEPQTISTELVEAQMAGTDLNQRLHLMTMQILSRSRLSRIIDDLGLYAEESKEMTREEVIELMRRRIVVVPVLPALAVESASNRTPEINTFQLFFRDDSPRMAAAVANRLANDFIEEHIRERVQISTDTSEFIEAELARLAVQIQDVEGRIAQVKAENPGRLPEDVVSNQRLYERLIENFRNSQRTLAEAESDEAFYRQQAMISPDYENRDANPERRLEVLELQLAGLYSRGFTEKHPDIVAVKEEIEEVKRKVERDAAADTANERPRSAAQQGADAEMRRAGLRAAAARADIERLQQHVDEVQDRLAQTPRVAERLGALERDYEHLFKSFQEYSNKRLEASVAANAERRQKGEKLRVLESAVPPVEPSSPNRLMIVVLGALAGAALGGGAAILLEVADSSFHGGRDLQAAFRLPVLAQIPGITLESDRVAQRRRRAMATVAAAGIVGVVLLGAAAGYWAVNGPGFGSQEEAAQPQAPAGPAAPAPEPPGR